MDNRPTFLYLDSHFMERWRKNLYILCGTQFLGMMAMSLVVPFLPFFIRELGVTNQEDLARWSGLVFSGTFMTAFVATPFWGALGDKHGRKLMVVRAFFGIFVSQMLMGLSQDVVQLFAFRLLQGALSGFIASTLALVSTSTPREKIGFSLGMLQSSSAAGTVIGPFFGGALADLIGYREIFFFVAILTLCAGIVVLRLVHEAPDGRSVNIPTSPLHNFRLMFTDRRLRVIALTLVFAQMSVQMIEPIFALFIESFGSESRFLSTLTGALFAIAGIFMFISAPWWGKRNDRLGFKHNLVMAIAGTGVAYSFHLIAPSLLVLTGLRALVGFARGGILPALYSLASIHAPSDRKSGMIGIASSLTILGNMLGPLLGGFVGGEFGVRMCFAFSSALLFVTSLIVLKFLEVKTDPPGSTEPARPNTSGIS
jgi:DHA1 family multidrug resistance protein-like MFS transporter